MKKINIQMFAGVGLALVVACAIGTRAQSSEAQSAATTPKMAEEVYKNIQVLKGIPADEVIPTMQSFLWSLGVGCEYCHVMGKFPLDVKDNKQTARRMIQMELTANKTAFGGAHKVTCYTCHQGNTKPIGMPSDATQKSGDELAGVNAGILPSADDLLNRYVAAVGGTNAVEKVSSVVAKGTFTDRRNGVQSPLEIFSGAPDKGLSVVHSEVLGEARNPLGDNIEGYNGDRGWITDDNAPVIPGRPMRPARDMTNAEMDITRLENPFYLPGHVKQMFTELHVERTEKIGDREAYLIVGRTRGLSPVKLYFDKDSGLLVRVVHYDGLTLGVNLGQIDYGNYRDVAGLKIPFLLTMNGQTFKGHLFSYRIDQAQTNAVIDSSKFVKPEVSVASK